MKRGLLLLLLLLVPFVSAAGVEKVGIQDKSVVITIQGKVNSQIEFFKGGASRGTYKLCPHNICEFKTGWEFKISLSTTGINEIGDYVLRIEEINDKGQATVQSYNLKINKENLDACIDNTLEGACSTNRPLFCERGELVERCGKGTFFYYTLSPDAGIVTLHTREKCGECPAGTCWGDGKCKVFVPVLVEEKKVNETESTEAEVEPTPLGFNNKNMNLYSEKEAFLISDKNWQDVLQLVPLTTWTINADESCPNEMNELPSDYINLPNKKVCAYPTLIYHEEENGFDADSIIYFMQQYNTKKATIIGDTPQELDNLLVTEPELGAGLNYGNIQRIRDYNYLSYWSSYDTIVYVEDNYELALVASAYASLLNAPLVIQGGILDNNNNLNGRKIICVGDTGINDCNENYNLEQLEKKYIDEANTDKIILVNPNDLIGSRFDRLQPDKSANIVSTIYYKDSLASPMLASAKHELILPVQSNDYNEIDNFFTSKLSQYYNTFPININCNAGNDPGCSSGFDKRVSKQVYIAENSVIYNLSSDIAQDAPFTIFFGGIMSECDGGLSVDLYNNNRFIGTTTVGCQDKKEIILDYSSFAIYFENIYHIEKGELELRFNKAKFYVDPDSLFNIYSDKGGVISSCHSMESDCAPNLNPTYITGIFSDKPSSFNFDNFDRNKDYLLTVSLTGKYIKEAKIFFNDNELDSFENLYGHEIKSFKVPKGYRTKKNVVRIVPTFFDDTNGMYSVDITLTSPLELPYYLTIIGSPDVIPMSRPSNCGGLIDKVEADGRIYGSLNNYGWINLAVGRIMGLSTSDTSGYIARDIFFDTLPKNRDALIVVREDYQDEIEKIHDQLVVSGQQSNEEIILEKYARDYFWTSDIRKQFNDEYFYSGHEEVSAQKDAIYDRYSKVYLNLFDDHGWQGGFAGMMDSDYLVSNGINLQPSLVIDIACSTCKYSGQKNLFCVQGIRRGVLAQQGAVEVSYWNQEFDNILDETILKGKTIGEAYRDARNEEYIEDEYGCGDIRGDSFYALLGDPTWRPRWW